MVPVQVHEERVNCWFRDSLALFEELNFRGKEF
jgi:hypothetical protein